MKTWYCVTTTFDDRGKVTACLTDTVERETCPENSHNTTARKDIYHDWFEDVDDANAWIQEALANNPGSSCE